MSQELAKSIIELEVKIEESEQLLYFFNEKYISDDEYREAIDAAATLKQHLKNVRLKIRKNGRV